MTLWRIFTRQRSVGTHHQHREQPEQKKASVSNFGKVWFDDRAIANIFGMVDLKKKFRVTFDSAKEDAFLVHMDGNIIKFKCNQEGLYEYKPTEDYKRSLKKPQDVTKRVSNMVSSVEENKKGYTERQFLRAKAARRLYHNVGTPSVENFKGLIAVSYTHLTLPTILLV